MDRKFFIGQLLKRYLKPKGKLYYLNLILHNTSQKTVHHSQKGVNWVYIDKKAKNSQSQK